MMPDDASVVDDAPRTTCGGCLCVDPSWSCAETTQVNERGEAIELAREVGMLEFDAGREASARMWYSFYPADDAPEDKPVLLFFNGGPYAATLLSGTGTGPHNAYDTQPTDNADAWTRFANLLYVDAANAGFSYSHGRRARDLYAREDAEMFTRTLLAFLPRHPPLQDNRVGLVGESYGGARIAIMLDQVFGFARFGVRSDVFVKELGDHFEAVFGEREPSPERIAQQFAYQVYIQGMIGRLRNEPCPGATYASYDCSDMNDTLSRQLTHVVSTFLHPSHWQRFYGHDLATVAWLRPEHRQGVYHGYGEAPDLLMTLLLGQLGEDDDYYVRHAFGDHGVLTDRTFTRSVTHALLAHARLVRTLLTDAVDDRVVLTFDLPDLAMQARVPNLVAATHDTAPRDGIARPGWMKVSFEGEDAFEIRAPRYEAGHMVPIRAGRELAEDVQQLIVPPASP